MINRTPNRWDSLSSRLSEWTRVESVPKRIRRLSAPFTDNPNHPADRRLAGFHRYKSAKAWHYRTARIASALEHLAEQASDLSGVLERALARPFKGTDLEGLTEVYSAAVARVMVGQLSWIGFSPNKAVAAGLYLLSCAMSTTTLLSRSALPPQVIRMPRNTHNQQIAPPPQSHHLRNTPQLSKLSALWNSPEKAPPITRMLMQISKVLLHGVNKLGAAHDRYLGYWIGRKILAPHIGQIMGIRVAGLLCATAATGLSWVMSPLLVSLWQIGAAACLLATFMMATALVIHRFEDNAQSACQPQLATQVRS